MDIKQWLKEHLEDLDSREMKYFHWYLQTDGFKPIKKGQLEDADRLDTVNLMVQTYASNTKTVTEKILEKIKSNKGLTDGRKCLKHQTNFLLNIYSGSQQTKVFLRWRSRFLQRLQMKVHLVCSSESGLHRKVSIK
uniref:Pyrin domain-containing protein n=1 Tax=Poecilia latipinna TaxID=48699 RepID=A0A3B3U230_9TELE